MKKVFLFILSLIISATIYGQWSTAKLSEARSSIYPIVYGSKAFFIGGQTKTGYSKKVDIYNYNTNKWSVINLSSTPDILFNTPAIVNGSKLFVLENGSVVESIDTLTLSIEKMSLSKSRSGISIGKISDLVFFAGGYDGKFMVSTIDIYNIKTKQWTIKNLSQPRAYCTIGTIENKIIFAGGITEDKISDKIDVYDIATYTWDDNFLSEPRAMMATTNVGGKIIFAGGGIFDFNYYNNVDIYNSQTNEWSSSNLSQFSFANTLLGLSSNGIAYFTGGQPQNIIDIYYSSTNTWSYIFMPRKHSLNPFLYLNGNIIIPGGINSNGIVDVYNVNKNSWSQVGALSSNRYKTAGAAIGNKILVAGGELSDGSISDIVDIYAFNFTRVEDIEFVSMNLFPDPFTDLINFNFERPETGVFSLYNSNSNEIISRSYLEVTSNQIATSELPSGIYYWQWKNVRDGKNIFGKIIKI